MFREDTDASIMEGEYEWVREYLYDVKQDEEKRTYILRETPSYMGYVDLNTRLMVHKRGKRLKSETAAQQTEFPRPETVSSEPIICVGFMFPLHKHQGTLPQHMAHNVSVVLPQATRCKAHNLTLLHCTQFELILLTWISKCIPTILLQISVTRTYPDGYEPPPKRRQVEQRQSQEPTQQQHTADINSERMGNAEPVDTIQPPAGSQQDMYAGLGLESLDEED